VAELEKMKVFSQIPTIDSLTKALSAAGFLTTINKGSLKVKRRFNGTSTWGWLIPIDILGHESTEDSSPRSEDSLIRSNPLGTANREHRITVPSVPSVPCDDERCFEKDFFPFSYEKEKCFEHTSIGTFGALGTANNNIIIINSNDSDFNGTTSVPSGVPTDEVTWNTSQAKMPCDPYTTETIRVEDPQAWSQALTVKAQPPHPVDCEIARIGIARNETSTPAPAEFTQDLSPSTKGTLDAAEWSIANRDGPVTTSMIAQRAGVSEDRAKFTLEMHGWTRDGLLQWHRSGSG
jgi:hypothetical protein